MNPGEELYNSLNKIKTMVYNLVAEKRLKQTEIYDFDAVIDVAFNAITEQRETLNKAWEEKKAAAQSRNKELKRNKKLHIILEMLGLTFTGRNTLISYPLPFLEAINRKFAKNKIVIRGENHFQLIAQEYRITQANINRDRFNIMAIATQRNMYKSKNPEIKNLAKQIMQQVAEESNHIVDDLRAGKTFDELQPKIEKYWYENINI